MVKQRAISGERMYDFILLDLDMPIMDGFKACQCIKQVHSNLEEKNQVNQTNETDQGGWLIELNSVFNQYMESRGIEDSESQILNYLKDFYSRMKFHALDYMKQPLIFAFSALLNNEIEEKAKAYGFDGCIMSPLTTCNITDILNRLENITSNYLANNLDHPELIDHLTQSPQDLVKRVSN